MLCGVPPGKAITNNITLKLLGGAVSSLNDGKSGVGFQECIYKSKVPYYIQTYIHNFLHLAVQLYEGGSLYIFLMTT